MSCLARLFCPVLPLSALPFFYYSALLCPLFVLIYLFIYLLHGVFTCAIPAVWRRSVLALRTAAVDALGCPVPRLPQAGSSTLY
jgi:hypothetical protein